MDVLRAALGEETLDYFGVLLRHQLGATYAELFPEQGRPLRPRRRRRPAADVRESSLEPGGRLRDGAGAYVAELRRRAATASSATPSTRVSAGSATCSTTSTTEPLPTDDERDLTDRQRVLRPRPAALQPRQLALPDQGLQQAFDGDGSTLLLLSDVYGSREADGSYADNSLEAIYAINCLDDPTLDRARPGAAPDCPDFEEASPTFGEVFAWGLVSCRGLQVEPAERAAGDPRRGRRADRRRSAPPATPRRRTRRPSRWPSSSSPASWSAATATATPATTRATTASTTRSRTT